MNVRVLPLCCALLISACGQSGPLVLPDHARPSARPSVLDAVVAPAAPAAPAVPATGAAADDESDARSSKPKQ